MPNGAVVYGYYHEFRYSGDSKIGKYIVSNGSLPPGVGMNWADAGYAMFYINGKPTQAGTYSLPTNYETNVPYQEINEKSLNYFLPEATAIRMHVAEALVEIKKDKEDIGVDVLTIQDIQQELMAVFKDAEYENLYMMHGKIPTNVSRMYEYTWLTNKPGVMQGNTDGYFMPYSNITRAELVTAIDRMLEQK